MLRVLALVVVLALLVVLPFAVWGDNIESWLSIDESTDWFNSFGPWAWLAGIGLIAADIVLPIPATLVMTAMGIIYGPVLGGIVAAVGSIVSGLIGYGLCRLLGREFAVKLTGESGMQQAEDLFDRWGGLLVAGSRWLPVLPETVSFLAGLTRMPVARYTLALACGAVPLGFAYAVAGHLGEDRPVLTLISVMFVPVLLWLGFQHFVLRPAGHRTKG